MWLPRKLGKATASENLIQDLVFIKWPTMDLHAEAAEVFEAAKLVN